jgi:hypothetical protein
VSVVVDVVWGREECELASERGRGRDKRKREATPLVTIEASTTMPVERFATPQRAPNTYLDCVATRHMKRLAAGASLRKGRDSGRRKRERERERNVS